METMTMTIESAMTIATSRNLPVICYTFFDGSDASEQEIYEHFVWLATATDSEIQDWVDAYESSIN